MRQRYKEHAAIVFEIMRAWELYHDLSELLSLPLEDTTQASYNKRAAEVCQAAVRFAKSFEGVCGGRHRSWYLHLFVGINTSSRVKSRSMALCGRSPLRPSRAVAPASRGSK